MNPKTKGQAGAASKSKAAPASKNTKPSRQAPKPKRKEAEKAKPKPDKRDGRHLTTPKFKLHPTEEKRLIKTSNQRLKLHAERVSKRGVTVRSHGLQGRRAVPGWENTFLDALREIPSVRDACKAAGIHRATVYDKRESDSDFAEAWDDALKEGVESLESEAMRRAVHGTEKIKFHEDGSISELEVKYSDTLMITLLKAHRPDKYRETVEHSGSVKFLPLNELTDRLSNVITRSGGAK